MTPIATWTATLSLVVALGAVPLGPALAAGDGGESGGESAGGESGGSSGGDGLWCMDLRISISGSASVFESLSCLSSSTHRVATISPEPSTGS